jgi:hypothetical protein
VLTGCVRDFDVKANEFMFMPSQRHLELQLLGIKQLKNSIALHQAMALGVAIARHQAIEKFNCYASSYCFSQ